jgi:quercetin dioxygenase-like cupin family protein
MSTPHEDNTVQIGGLTLRFLVDETTGPTDVIIFEMTILPGARVPEPHYHATVDEFGYVLEGTMTSTIAGTPRDYTPGESLWIPRGTMHHHANRSEAPAKALFTLNPGTINKSYFQAIAEAVNVPGRPDPAKIQAIMERYGLHVA